MASPSAHPAEQPALPPAIDAVAPNPHLNLHFAVLIVPDKGHPVAHGAVNPHAVTRAIPDWGQAIKRRRTEHVCASGRQDVYGLSGAINVRLRA